MFCEADLHGKVLGSCLGFGSYFLSMPATLLPTIWGWLRLEVDHLLEVPVSLSLSVMEEINRWKVGG